MDKFEHRFGGNFNKADLSATHRGQYDQFLAWLKALGYREITVKAYARVLLELFHFIQQQDKSLDKEALIQFFLYLANRPNRRRPGGISGSYIRSFGNVVSKFLAFLFQFYNINIPFNRPGVKVERGSRRPLSLDQVNQVYRVIDQGKDRLLGRAIMAVFYGCGLRRTEGKELLIPDILFGKKMLIVRKGKFSKERAVPFSGKVGEDLMNYIEKDRPALPGTSPPYLFVNKRNQPAGDFVYYSHLREWKKAAGINQPLSLHVLRHSIATHLLQEGMDMEMISNFLGHKSLAATQIYTHILE